MQIRIELDVLGSTTRTSCMHKQPARGANGLSSYREPSHNINCCGTDTGHCLHGCGDEHYSHNHVRQGHSQVHSRMRICKPTSRQRELSAHQANSHASPHHTTPPALRFSHPTATTTTTTMMTMQCCPLISGRKKQQPQMFPPTTPSQPPPLQPPFSMPLPMPPHHKERMPQRLGRR